MNEENKKTILLVEDEAILAITGKKLLEQYGYNVVTADSGEKAVDSIDKIPGIDLVLMDIDLGSGIDGTRAAEIMLKSHDIPVVFLSSHTEPEVVEKTEKITSYGYVVKNSGITVLDVSIKMAFKLFNAKQQEKNKHEKLRESEEKYRLLHETAGVGIGYYTPDGTIISYNRVAAEHMNGLPEDFAGKSVFDLFSKQEADTYISRIQGAALSAEPVVYEDYVPLPSGDRYFMSTFTKINNSFNRISGIQIISQDITDRKLSEEIIKTKSEELESANEELTSAMEEMEATNEELISTNEELVRSEEKYRLLFLNMDSYNSMYEVVTDKEGNPCDFRFIMVNQAYENYVGKKASDLIGKTLLEVYPETEQYWIDAMTTAVLTGTQLRLENFSKEMNTYTEINLYTPQKGHLAMTTANIDDRKKIEIALQEREKQFRIMAENSIDVIWVMSFEGKFLYVSPSVIALTGYTPEETMEIPFEQTVFPESVSLAMDAIAQGLALPREKRTPVKIELKQRRKDGVVIDIESTGSILYDESGNPAGVQGSTRDITDRKKMMGELEAKIEELEQKDAFLKSLMETVPVPIFYKDIDGRYTGFNKSFESFFGKKRDDLIGKTVFDINPPELANLYHAKDAILFEKPDIQVYDSQVLNAYGNLRDVVFYKSSTVNAHGEVNGLVGAVHDITDRKIAEDKIKSLLAEKELILKEVHHRLKNNMNTVKGLLALQIAFLKDPLAISAMHDTISRVESMVVLYDKLYCSNNFTDISVLNYLPPLIDEIMSNFPGSKSVKVENKIDDFIIELRKLQALGIIINELLTNMMKHAFTGRENNLIAVSAKLEGQKVSIIISDNGGGIPESITFENSTGFGMKLVSILTEQIGGSIKIERGLGSKFVIEFEV